MSIRGISFIVLSIFFACLGFRAYSQDVEKFRDQEPFSLTGNLGASMMFYDVEGREMNRSPFVWMLTGSPTLTFYGIKFPFSFIVSEQQRDFRQPFNKFGVSPYYKWAKLHLGYRNLNWSRYSLAGHSIFGAGVELDPGKFHFGFVYGRLLKAVDPNDMRYEVDDSYVQTPAFKRTAYSVKLGYGTARNNAGVIILKGHDDPSSFLNPPASLMPAENFILSFNTHQQIGKILVFDLEVAESAYTRNIESNVPDSAEYFINEWFSGWYSSNASSFSSTALETSLKYPGKNFSAGIRFKRIDPGYRSMGAYFFQNDLQNITLEPSYRFGKQKYNLSGSLGFQRDNLEGDLPATTNRTIGSISFTANPVNFYNLNLTYSNYDMGQSQGINPIDSLYEISQTTQNLALSQNLTFAGESLSQNIMLVYNLQKLKDKNNNTADLNSYSSNMLMANYMLSLLDMGLTGSVGYNFTLFKLQDSENMISGPVFSVSKTLLKKKLSLMLSDNYYRNAIVYEEGNREDRISGINRISARATLRIAQKHRFSLKIYIKNSNAVTTNVDPFSERKGDIGYVYTF